MRSFVAAASLAAALAACKAEPRLPEGAVSLFDVRFAAPDDTPGQPPKVYETGATQTFPSAIPSQIFMGNPAVVDALCGLDQQPLRLTAQTGATGLEGLEFLLSQRYGRYHVELDLCVAELGPPPLPAFEPQLAVFLDFPQAYAVGFFSDGRIVIVDPERPLADGATPEEIGRWEAGKPLRLALDVDLEKQTWSISLDGKPAHSGPFAGFLARAVRVIVRGNPSNQVAFDDFKVWAEHDLGGDAAIANPKVGDE
jgi:hypothetical protein